MQCNSPAALIPSPICAWIAEKCIWHVLPEGSALLSAFCATLRCTAPNEVAQLELILSTHTRTYVFRWYTALAVVVMGQVASGMWHVCAVEWHGFALPVVVSGSFLLAWPSESAWVACNFCRLSCKVICRRKTITTNTMNQYVTKGAVRQMWHLFLGILQSRTSYLTEH